MKNIRTNSKNRKEKSTKRELKLTDSLLLLVKSGKFLGIFPVKILNNPEKTCRDFKSFIFIYSCLVCLLNFVVIFLTISDWIYTNFNGNKFGNNI